MFTRIPGIVCIGFLLSLAFALGSCEDKGKLDIASKLSPKKMPTMMSRNVETLISDSGYVQYKIVSPKWYVYDEANPPYWYFPEGLYLIKYDRELKPTASVACDSARYYKPDKLWLLMGNVELKQAPADLFVSQRLYWNQRTHKIYTDTFMHVETATQMLEGTGFISDENLREYRVLKPRGIFPVDRDKIRGEIGNGPSETPSVRPSARVDTVF